MKNMYQLGLEAIRFLADEDKAISEPYCICNTCNAHIEKGEDKHNKDCLHLECKDFIERYDKYKSKK